MTRARGNERVLEVCGGLGGILGLYWGSQHPPAKLNPASCRPHSGQDIGHCMGDGLAAAAKPYLLGASVGMIAGALIALAIVLLARALRRPQGRRPARPTGSPRTARAGRWITARYAGRCASCDGQIRPGDTIHHQPRQTRCESCATAPAHSLVAG